MSRGIFPGIFFATFVAGCASAPQPPPEPIVVTTEVDRIVQVRCEDRRPPASDYPDTDDRLAMIEEGDIFALAQAYRAGKTLRESRERENEAQIAACTGE